jgi:rod shape-determining protein MreC
MRKGLGRRRARARPIIVVVVLLATTLVTIDRMQDSGPIDAAGDVVRDAVAVSADGIASLNPFDDSDGSELENENERLRTELEEARGRLAQEEDLRRERNILRQLVDLPTHEDSPKVIADVTAFGVSNFDSTMELGKGTDDGIEVGMPVVTGEGLVGRVIETSRLRSTVLLVGDSTSNVGVRFTMSGEIGVAVGQGMSEDIRIDLIDLDSQIQQGEIAATSGTEGSLFPPGIPIGRVVSSDAGSRDLRRQVRVEPFVDASKLDSVAVVQWTSDSYRDDQ